MHDISDIIDNISTIYNSNSSLAILKDYERVFDELDLYVFENWIDGEIVKGPIVDRHWVTCTWMWPRDKMPNPEGAKRMHEYGCEVRYMKETIVLPRKIKSPSDIRPNSKKGKMDEHSVWFVEIAMPKKLMLDVFRGYHDRLENSNTASKAPAIAGQPEEQAAEAQSAPPVEGAPNAA